MMRRVPRWFNEKTKGHFHTFWPWLLSSATATMYLFNREPFEEIAGNILTKIRKPILKGTEWLERHDVDPESMVLELPPDMIFGPLEFEQQMKFTLAALRADNELADGYMTRLFIDYMDVSLDMPLLPEDKIVAGGVPELLDFAVQDFLDKRPGRKHKFFHPDTFLRLVNWVAPYPKLARQLIEKHDGVQLIFDALKFSKDDYARVLAMRSLTLFCFTQANDGDIEKRIMMANGVKVIVDCYKQSSGDPTDTRYLTILLSSILRHFPKEGGKEFLDADGIQATVNNLNIARYKGFPQHLRVLHDAQRTPKAAWGDKSPIQRILDADFVPVAFGVLDTFPEFYEVVGDMIYVLNDVAQTAAPFHFLEYRAFQVLAKVYVRYMEDHVFQTDGTRHAMAQFVRKIWDDPVCQKYLDPSVLSYEMQAAVKTMQHLMEADRTNRLSPIDGTRR